MREGSAERMDLSRLISTAKRLGDVDLLRLIAQGIVEMKRRRCRDTEAKKASRK